MTETADAIDGVVLDLVIDYLTYVLVAGRGAVALRPDAGRPVVLASALSSCSPPRSISPIRG